MRPKPNLVKYLKYASLAVVIISYRTFATKDKKVVIEVSEVITPRNVHDSFRIIRLLLLLIPEHMLAHCNSCLTCITLY